MEQTKSLSDLKLKSWDEWRTLWNSGPEFQNFAMQVYRYLESMKPGTSLRLDRYSGRTLEWVIKTGCVFILEGNNSIEYEFNEDYTEIVHRVVPEDIIKWTLALCKQRV